MFNISRAQADALSAADVIESVQTAARNFSGVVARNIANITSSPVALSNPASALNESESTLWLDKISSEVIEKICHYLPNLSDYVALGGVLQTRGKDEVLRTFSRLTSEQKKQQWIRFVIGGNEEMTAFCLAAGVNGDILNAMDVNGNTALALAAEIGNAEIVRMLLNYPGIAPNFAVPLIRAAAKGHAEIVALFLQERGINVNAIDEQGSTALEMAATIASKEIVQMLLGRADILPEHGIALLLAASKGHQEIVALLLKKGCLNINAVDRHGNTALGLAARGGHKKIIEMLLSRSDINTNLGAPLLQATSKGRLGLFCVLLSIPGININTTDRNGNSALGAAAGIGNARMVEILLRHPDIVPHIGTPLVQAAAGGHMSIFLTLLKTPSININAVDGCGNTALGAAAGNGNVGIVRRLLRCLNIRPNAGVPLLRATMSEKEEMVALLLQTPGININATDGQGKTALGIAARAGNAEIFQMLLNRPYIDINLGIPLLHAASKGHIALAEQLLSMSGIDVNLTDHQGNSALGFAARSGSADIVRMLLRRPDIDVNLGLPLLQAASRGHQAIMQDLLEAQGSNVNLVDRIGISSLGIAAGMGNVNIVEMLLNHPDIDVNIGVPLRYAAVNGHLAMIHRLMQVPAINVNATDSNGYPALVGAAVIGHVQIIDLLLSHPAIDPNLGTPLTEAAAQGHLECVAVLLRADHMNVNAANLDGDTALGLAADYGSLSIVKRLLNHPHIDPNAGAPLVNAAGKGHLEAVLALLRAPAININAPSRSSDIALTAAAYGNHTEIVDILLKVTNVDVNVVDASGHTALFWAASIGNVEMIEMLLGCADINMVEVRNFSALVKAVSNGHADIVRMLLDRPDIDPNQGALLMEALSEGHLDLFEMLMERQDIDVNRADEMGDTALEWAACCGQMNVAMRLLNHPQIDPNRGAPLAQAASRGELDLVRALLNADGIDVNCRGEFGATALLHACFRGQMDIVRILLEVPGIDVQARNEFGQGAVDVTPLEYRSEVERLLRQHRN